MHKKINLELSEEHLPVLLQALESFVRAKLFQFDYWLEQCFPEHCEQLDWDTKKDIQAFLKEKLLKNSKFTENRGIYNKECIENGATAAHEIYQVLKVYKNVARNNGLWGTHTGFHEPLTDEIGSNKGKSGIELPKVLGFNNYIDVIIRGFCQEKTRELLRAQKYKEFWEYFDKNIGKKYKCDKYEVIKKKQKYFIRYHKPRKAEKL